jgi:protein CpxP
MQRLQRITRSVVAAVVLGAGLMALPAAAERGHGGHGHHRGHHGGDQLFGRLAEVKSQLNLDASQQALWDSAVVAGKAAREAGRARRASIHDVVAQEAASAKPDLARIAATTDKVQDSNATDRRAVRDQWLKLYATFRPDQVAVVKTMLTNRLSRMDSFRERMQRRSGQQ